MLKSIVFFVLGGAIASPILAAEDASALLARLEQQCEAAREARIAPLRAAEIAKCKADKRADPGYCERFWADLGNGHKNANGAWVPRMFDDLPECVAADEARRENNVK